MSKPTTSFSFLDPCFYNADNSIILSTRGYTPRRKDGGIVDPQLSILVLKRKVNIFGGIFQGPDIFKELYILPSNC